MNSWTTPSTRTAQIRALLGGIFTIFFFIIFLISGEWVTIGVAGITLLLTIWQVIMLQRKKE